MTKILCIEDEADYREGLVDFLSSSGFEVDEAEDGESGMQKALNGDHDLILCDIKLPKKNGYEILKELQQTNKNNVPKPFIFLSAFGQKDNIRTGFDMGASYLVKPVDFDLLLSKINFRLNNQKQTETLTAKSEKRSRNSIIQSIRGDINTSLKLTGRFSEIIMNQELGTIGNPKYAAYAKLINEFSQRLVNMVNEITQTMEDNEAQIAQPMCSDIESVMWKIRLRLDDIHDIPHDAVDFRITDGELVISADADLIAKMVSNIAASISKKGESLQKIIVACDVDDSKMASISVMPASLESVAFNKCTLKELINKDALAGSMILPLEFANETAATLGGGLALFAETGGGLKATVHLPLLS